MDSTFAELSNKVKLATDGEEEELLPAQVNKMRISEEGFHMGQRTKVPDEFL